MLLGSGAVDEPCIFVCPLRMHLIDRPRTIHGLSLGGGLGPPPHSRPVQFARAAQLRGIHRGLVAVRSDKPMLPSESSRLRPNAPVVKGAEGRPLAHVLARPLAKMPFGGPLS
jgi:hypothetical protein